jgi:hypothetical protein
VAGGASFNDVAFTFVGIADSKSASVHPAATSLAFPSPTITIAGVGTLTFTNTFGFTGLVHPFTAGGVTSYVSALGEDTVDLIDFSDPKFHGWDFLSPFGPEGVKFFGSGGENMPPQTDMTDAGALYFTDASDLVFSVTRAGAVPETASAVLLLSGMLVLIGGVSLRRRQKVNRGEPAAGVPKWSQA